jgi:hypothetical protein
MGGNQACRYQQQGNLQGKTVTEAPAANIQMLEKSKTKTRVDKYTPCVCH